MEVYRYVPENKYNYNGILYEPKSLNQALNEFLEKSPYVCKYSSVNNGIKWYIDPSDVIGIIKRFNAETVSVDFNEGIEFENPVALISVVAEETDEKHVYKVLRISGITITEEDYLVKPRIK